MRQQVPFLALFERQDRKIARDWTRPNRNKAKEKGSPVIAEPFFMCDIQFKKVPSNNRFPTHLLCLPENTEREHRAGIGDAVPAFPGLPGVLQSESSLAVRFAA